MLFCLKKSISKFHVVALALLFAVTVAGCGGGSSKKAAMPDEDDGMPMRCRCRCGRWLMQRAVDAKAMESWARKDRWRCPSTRIRSLTTIWSTARRVRSPTLRMMPRNLRRAVIRQRHRRLGGQRECACERR